MIPTLSVNLTKTRSGHHSNTPLLVSFASIPASSNRYFRKPPRIACQRGETSSRDQTRRPPPRVLPSFTRTQAAPNGSGPWTRYTEHESRQRRNCLADLTEVYLLSHIFVNQGKNLIGVEDKNLIPASNATLLVSNTPCMLSEGLSIKVREMTRFKVREMHC